MPVIECSCGMVMSVPVEGPRVCCIRCGGVEFHILERRAMGPARRRDALLVATTACTAPPAFVFANMSNGEGGPLPPISSGYTDVGQ